MDMQLLLAIIIGGIAFLYLFNRLKRQFTKIEKDPKCEDCPASDGQLIDDKKK